LGLVRKTGLANPLLNRVSESVKAAALDTVPAAAFSSVSQRALERGALEAWTGVEKATEELFVRWSATADVAAIGPAARDVAIVTASSARLNRDVSDGREMTIQAASGVTRVRGGRSIWATGRVRSSPVGGILST
jgi:NAD(P)H-dependent flavin oxidoreductase YrpB (nitropropane dioxygenase family)